MNTSKFLLGMLIVALTVPAFSSQITLIKERDVGDPDAYIIGDTIHFVCTVVNPVGNSETNTLEDIFDTLPDGVTVIHLNAGDVVLAPGESVTYNVDYVVAAGDLQTLPSGKTGVINQLNAVGYDTADDLIDAGTTKSALVYAPGISLEKVGDIRGFCVDGEVSVTYTYSVENIGDEDLEDIAVFDDTCGPITGPSGDGGDGLLNPGEIWTYECTMLISETTLNLASAEGIGVNTGVRVEDVSEWLVEAVDPPGVVVTLTPPEICEGGSSRACAVVTGAIGDIEYSWSTGEATECITISEAGEVCVTIKDLATGCEAEACATLIVNPNPTCSIEAVADPVCPSADGNLLTATADGPAPIVSWTWEVTEGTGWEIVSGQGTNTIEYSVAEDASDCATFKLTIIDDNGCEGTCQIEVCCTGDVFCSFTQGFYGNAGGKACGGLTTAEIIEAAGLPVVVGRPGKSITFDSNECIIELLPAGGKPSALPNGSFGDEYCDNLPNSILKKGRINNVLVGQVVALTLNLRLHNIPCNEEGSDLGNFELPEEFCVIPYGDPEACPMKYTIPELLVGKTAQQLLDWANDALAGLELPEGITIGMLYEGASALNEGFDECATKVACPTEEICCNGCDDDFNGLTDGDDPACAEICDDEIDNDCDGLVDLDDVDDCLIIIEPAI